MTVQVKAHYQTYRSDQIHSVRASGKQYRAFLRWNVWSLLLSLDEVDIYHLSRVWKHCYHSAFGPKIGQLTEEMGIHFGRAKEIWEKGHPQTALAQEKP